MSYKNPKELLDAATALPVAIEAKLPAGAPKISQKLLEFDSKVIVKLPNFPFALPNLPPIPTMPGAPTQAAARRFITSAREGPVPSPSPRAVGTRGML